MDEKQYQELVEKLGKEAADQIKAQMKTATDEMNAKAIDTAKGLMTQKSFDEFKADQIDKINSGLKKLEDVTKEQGNKINAVLEKAAPNTKSLEAFIVEQADLIKELRSSGKSVEFTSTQLKAAGITSIGTSITDMTAPPGSPYAPGLAGGLDIFTMMHDPRFILDKVDLGSTNSSRLAWINETDYQGAPAEVAEGAAKPQTQHIFQVEMSVAKKMAAWIKITDEFEQDLPYLATQVRRMLQEDVMRGWDDAIQQAVIDAAHQYEISGLDSSIDTANYWDALLAMMAQVRFYNFIPNSIGINPLTSVQLKTAKSATDKLYLLPSFADEILSILTEANKVAVGKAFVGDLKQFKVDVYKDFVLKIGWVNDDFINNQFCIVGEIRYHRYISDARKKAIVYDSLNDVKTDINGTPGS